MYAVCADYIVAKHEVAVNLLPQIFSPSLKSGSLISNQLFLQTLIATSGDIGTLHCTMGIFGSILATAASMTTLSGSSLYYSTLNAFNLLANSPENYGAKGNGSDDDTTCLSNAILAYTDIVCGLNKNYLIGSTAAMDVSGKTIDLNGSTIT